MSPLETQNSRYWAYANYLTAFARLIGALYPHDRRLAKRVAVSPGFHKLRRKPHADRSRTAELLRSSWFTELLLTRSVRYPELLPYANPWAMVQAYYALYLAIRAYFLACGRDVGRSHQATLRTLAADFLSCKDRFPAPWSCLLQGDPASTPLRLTNSPFRRPITLTNPLASPLQQDPWQHFGLFLKTTRQRKLSVAIGQWKNEQDRKVIRAPERAALIANLRPTSFFDALYRMRARSNYQDVDSFAFGDVSEQDAMQLHEALVGIIHSTLLVFEMMVVRASGIRWYGQVVEDFFSTPAGQPAVETVLARWVVIRQALRDARDRK